MVRMPLYLNKNMNSKHKRRCLAPSRPAPLNLNLAAAARAYLRYAYFKRRPGCWPEVSCPPSHARSYFSPPLADLDSGYLARNYAVYINANILHDILDTAYYLAMAGTCAARGSYCCIVLCIGQCFVR